MFKLQRLNKHSSNSRERVDFRFSNFQVLQVPKGWERLLVSVISIETGKTITKLGKVVVKNGSCQWPESLVESIMLSQDNSSKETSECYFKFVVSSGAAKLGVLGEVTLNMAQYMSSGVSASVSFPLQRCNYGTVFQVKIHCLAPRTKHRVNESKNSELRNENKDIEYRDGASISNGSDSSFSGSVDSSSSQNRREFDNNARSNCSISSSNRSFDEASSISKVPCPRENSEEQKISASSKNQLEIAEVTIEELRAVAKMWERNARKLMLDLDSMSKEYSDQSKKQSDLVMELSEAYSEHEVLKKEIGNLKALNIKSNGVERIKTELEKEIKYQQETNVNLASQLKRSQESNVELVNVLQELEETIERQRIEIENLSTMCGNLEEKLSESETLREKVEELERDCNELTDENLELLFKLKELNNATSRCASFKSTSTELPASNGSEVNDEHSLELNRELEMVSLMVQEHEGSKEKLETEYWKLVSDIEELKSSLEMKTQENELLIEREKDLLAEVSGLVEKLEVVSKGSDITAKSLANLENELVKLGKDLDFEKMVFEEKLLKMENEKHELERQFLYLKEENVELKTSNMELTQKKLELLKGYDHMETLLEESQGRVFNFLKRVENIEENVFSTMEGFSLEEKRVSLELDALLEAKKDVERDQLQKIDEIQDEVTGLKSELMECRSEKGKLEAKLQKITRDHNDLTAEKNWYVQKISSLEAAMLELEVAKGENEKSTVDLEVVAKEIYDQTKSTLEMELRELRERYSEMSLQYAEGEAEREDLIMKLKAAKSGKKWFS